MKSKIEPRTRPNVVAEPPDPGVALNGNAKAGAAIEDAKPIESRKRRIGKLAETMKGGPG